MGFMISDFMRTMAHTRGRLTRGKRPTVLYFHQADDPYSHMANQKLAALKDRYTVDFVTYPVSMPEAEFQGDSSRFQDWALKDAMSIAPFYGVELPDDFGESPSEQTEAGDRLREQLGHYLSGTFYFEGEWYWGLDRLHHLEQRLIVHAE